MAAITSLSQLDLAGSYTYADYERWQFDERVELIKGALFLPMRETNRRHQQCVGNLLGPIYSFVKGTRTQVYFNLDVRLPAGDGNHADAHINTVVNPDLWVVGDPAQLDERGCLGAPDWIVEIIAPGTGGRDTKIKLDLYEESGVPEYWTIYPGEKSVAVYALENERYQLVAEYFEPGPIPVRTLPGLALEWAEVFEGA